MVLGHKQAVQNEWSRLFHFQLSFMWPPSGTGRLVKSFWSRMLSLCGVVDGGMATFRKVSILGKEVLHEPFCQ
jgi:hypothetical protein